MKAMGNFTAKLKFCPFYSITPILLYLLHTVHTKLRINVMRVCVCVGGGGNPATSSSPTSLKIHFNITLSTSPRSLEWSLPLSPFRPLPCVLHVPHEQIATVKGKGKVVPML